MTHSIYERLFQTSHRFGPGDVVTITDPDSTYYEEMAEVLLAQDLQHSQHLWIRTKPIMAYVGGMGSSKTTKLWIYSWKVEYLNTTLPSEVRI